MSLSLLFPALLTAGNVLPDQAKPGSPILSWGTTSTGVDHLARARA